MYFKFVFLGLKNIVDLSVNFMPITGSNYFISRHQAGNYDWDANSTRIGSLSASLE